MFMDFPYSKPGDERKNKIEEVDGFEIKRLVREAIMPEMIKALKEGYLREEFREALGIKK